MKRGNIFLIISIALLLTLLPFASAAHFIIGQVDDAYDLTNADGHTVVIWNSANGIDDNITDIIGTSGNSGSSNIYMIDCELLGSACNVGDILSLKILNNGDNYISDFFNVTVTGSGFDVAPNIRLNSPPTVNLISPVNHYNSSSGFSFVCNASDLDGNLASASLYGNWSGIFSINDSNIVSGYNNSSSFSPNIPEGRYLWGCQVEDALGITGISSNNYSFTFDPNSPVISFVYLNSSLVCGTNNYLRVYCNVSDSFIGLDNIRIMSSSVLGNQYYSTNLISSGSYYADLLANQEGVWNFTCFANDTFSNSANFTSSSINVSNSSADFFVSSNNIFFDKSSIVEGETVNVSADVFNLGCLNTSGVITAFYLGDPNLGGTQIQNNFSLSISPYGNLTISAIWNANININNVFLVADINNSFNEYSESNNKANKSFIVSSWHVYYGKLNNDKLLASYNLQNLTYWLNESNVSGNVYVTDVESSIDWSNLYPIGLNVSFGITNNDFSDIDNLLGSSTYNDSVSNLFTSDGNTPRLNTSFLVHHKNINNVPIINSTNTSNFITGILWDATSDLDGEYSVGDNEDLVFLTKVNKNSLGQYGTYDYEINIPVKLRSYHTSNQNDVYIYFDLY